MMDTVQQSLDSGIVAHWLKLKSLGRRSLSRVQQVPKHVG